MSEIREGILKSLNGIVLPYRFKSTFVTADLTHTITQKKRKLDLQRKTTSLPHLPADLKKIVLADLTWIK